MRYINNRKKTLLTPAQSYPMIWGCFGANVLRCVHFEHKKTNETEFLFNFFVIYSVNIKSLLFLPHKVLRHFI